MNVVFAALSCYLYRIIESLILYQRSEFRISIAVAPNKLYGRCVYDVSVSNYQI